MTHEKMRDKETRELIAQAHSGDINARDKVALHHQRLVSKAVVYVLKSKQHPLYGDCFAIATDALFKSIENFKFNKNARFTSYSSECMRGQVLKFLKRSDKAIRTPLGHDVDIAMLEYIEQTSNKNATDKELLERLGWEQKKLDRIRYSRVLNTESLDELKENHGDRLSIGSCKINIETETINSMTINELLPIAKEALSSKKPAIIRDPKRAWDILIMYENGYEFKEIGKKYNITRQRAHQIKNKALKKIQTHFSRHGCIDNPLIK